MDARLLLTDLDATHIFLERYLNAGSPSGFTEIHKTSKETNPFTGKEKFPILCFNDDDIESVTIGDSLPAFWNFNFNFAHPDSNESNIIKKAKREVLLTDFLVSPTSGGRTMFVWDRNPAGYLKLTYDVSRIGRVDRQLSTKHCFASYESSQTFKRTFDDGKFPEFMAIQLEPAAKISLIPHEHETYEWGVIFREKLPYPYIEEKRQLVPGFSLFFNDSVDEPLIIQFILLGGYDPLTYLTDFLKKIIDCYWSIVLNCGFHIECHGQNCLFEVDDKYNIVRMVIKDMDSVDKDIPLAEYLGLNSKWDSYPQCCFDKNIHFYDIRASYMYDFKLGEYLLTPIIDAVGKYFRLNISHIQKQIKDYVQSTYVPYLPSWYFPEDGCWYDCDNTERKPGTKRVYTANKDPKFR